MSEHIEIQIPDDEVEVAKLAIRMLGGPTKVARALQLKGLPVTRDMVQKWAVNGINGRWCPHIHDMTGIPLNNINAALYPEHLFK